MAHHVVSSVWGTSHHLWHIEQCFESMYIYICFPWMIHRNEMAHRHANCMPKEILDLFWGNILLPAIHQHSDIDVAPYMTLTLDKVWFKARKRHKKRPRHLKVVPFSMITLKGIEVMMKRIIQQDPSWFLWYGSLFFVLECKGIKLWTKTFLHDMTPIDAPLNGIPAFDWKHMINRDNGKLLVDLSIAIHLACEQKLVCFEEAIGFVLSQGGGDGHSTKRDCTLNEPLTKCELMWFACRKP